VLRSSCALTSSCFASTYCSFIELNGHISAATPPPAPQIYRTTTSRKFCQPGYGAADGRRRDQDERFNRARAQEQEARGTGRHRAFGGMPPPQRHIHQRDGLCISGREFGQSISASDFCSAHRRACQPTHEQRKARRPYMTPSRVSQLQDLKPTGVRCVKCHAPSTRCYTWRKVGITSNAKPADLIMTSLTSYWVWRGSSRRAIS
jgi:hypothetical protein